jgi:beta-fructofuranosidase
MTAFRKTGQVLISAADHEPYEFNDWSDPYLVEHDGATYMVCGGNARPTGGQAVVHIYQSESADLMKWRHLGRLFCHLDRAAITMECPGLMKIGQKWVLWGCSYRPCDYWVGQIDFDRMVFVPERYGILDGGSAYAGRLIPVPDGRIVICQHVYTMLPPSRSWNNVMAMPRLADLDDDGAIRQKPWPEFEQLRGPRRALEALTLDRESRSLPSEFSGDSLEFQVAIRAITARTVGLRLRSAPNRDPGAVIQFHPGSGGLAVNDRWAFYSRKKEIRLRVFLDRRVVEVFTDDGLVGLATIVNADRESLGIECFALDGSAEFHSFELWPMSPARFSLEHFSPWRAGE